MTSSKKNSPSSDQNKNSPLTESDLQSLKKVIEKSREEVAKKPKGGKDEFQKVL